MPVENFAKTVIKSFTKEKILIINKSYESVSNLLESIMDTNQISKAFFFFNSIDNKDVVKGKPSTSPRRSTNTSLMQEEKLNVK